MATWSVVRTPDSTHFSSLSLKIKSPLPRHPKNSPAFPSFFPAVISASRSSRKPIMGATPVPGPTITTGVSGFSEGYLNVDCSLRTVPTISSPGTGRQQWA